MGGSQITVVAPASELIRSAAAAQIRVLMIALRRRTKELRYGI